MVGGPTTRTLNEESGRGARKMTDHENVDEENSKVLAALAARFEAAGIAPGPDGYDRETLARVISERRWTGGVEPVSDGYWGIIVGPMQRVRSLAWSPEAALARSLDRALTWPRSRGNKGGDNEGGEDGGE